MSAKIYDSGAAKQKAYRERIALEGLTSKNPRKSSAVKQKAYRERLAQAKAADEQVTVTLRDQLLEARLENMGSRMRRVHDEWAVSGVVPAEATAILLDTIRAFIPDELEQFYRADQLKRVVNLFSDMNP